MTASAMRVCPASQVCFTDSTARVPTRFRRLLSAFGSALGVPRLTVQFEEPGPADQRAPMWVARAQAAPKRQMIILAIHRGHPAVPRIVQWLDLALAVAHEMEHLAQWRRGEIPEMTPMLGEVSLQYYLGLPSEAGARWAAGRVLASWTHPVLGHAPRPEVGPGATWTEALAWRHRLVNVTPPPQDALAAAAAAVALSLASSTPMGPRLGRRARLG